MTNMKDTTNRLTNSPRRLNIEQTQAMIIDVQEKFEPHIFEIDKVAKRIAILAQGLQALDIPIMLNEQYPKGLGATLSSISQVLTTDNAKVFEKSEFSVCDCQSSWAHVEDYAKQGRTTIIICGIETHVCVQQTALDLLEKGLQPVLITDAVSSRFELERQVAIERMRDEGVVITTVEGALFEMCKSSKHPAFKTISKLVT